MTKCLYYHVPVTVSGAQCSVQRQVNLVSLEIGFIISIETGQEGYRITKITKLQILVLSSPTSNPCPEHLVPPSPSQ